MSFSLKYITIYQTFVYQMKQIYFLSTFSIFFLNLQISLSTSNLRLLTVLVLPIIMRKSRRFERIRPSNAVEVDDFPLRYIRLFKICPTSESKKCIATSSMSCAHEHSERAQIEQIAILTNRCSYCKIFFQTPTPKSVFCHACKKWRKKYFFLHGFWFFQCYQNFPCTFGKIIKTFILIEYNR